MAEDGAFLEVGAILGLWKQARKKSGIQKAK